MRFAAWLLAGLLSSCVQTQPISRDFLKSLEGMRYEQARTKLVEAGIVPVTFEREAGRYVCDERDFCDSYLEAINCSGVGIALCQFAYYSKATNEYLAVQTYGEEKLTVDRVYFLTADDRAYWAPETH